jgi:hypothetical protein
MPLTVSFNCVANYGNVFCENIIPVCLIIHIFYIFNTTLNFDILFLSDKSYLITLLQKPQYLIFILQGV